MYQFAMKCYRRPRNNTTFPDREFLASHPLFRSHCIAFRKRDAVPVIKGPRLPRLKLDSPPEERLKHAKIALVLFKAFRPLDDLIGAAPFDRHRRSWIDVYDEWEGTRSPFIQDVMCNMHDYYLGQEADDVVADNFQSLSDCDQSSSDSEDDAYLSDDMAEASDTERQEKDLLSTLYCDEQHMSDGLPDFPVPSQYEPRVQDVLAQFKNHQLIEDMSRAVAATNTSVEFGAVRSGLQMDANELKKWVLDPASDSRTSSDCDTDSVFASGQSIRVTEMIDEVLQPHRMQWASMPLNGETNPRLPDFCGIDTVSQAFTLNKLQHAAFAVIAKRLFQRWNGSSNQEDNTSILSDQALREQQLLFYLGGEGGTGKSRIISSLQHLCGSWQRPNAIVLTAMTGKAASIIGGRTLASVLMTLKSASGSSFAREIDCLIVDEVSMMSKYQLLRLDRALRKAKRIADVPFGGLHIVLVGDFYQLPPVGADPLYTIPTSKTNASLNDFEGFELWRMFEKAIILEQTVRFQSDPEWGEGCSQARHGTWTREFVEMINTRAISSSTQPRPDEHSSSATDTVFVTPDNTSRVAINEFFIATAARLLPPNVNSIRVVANFKGALNNLSRSDIAAVMDLPDTKFGRMAPYLDLVCGMPIQITQNLRTKKGVANGTMGQLRSVKFPDGTTFTRVRDQRNGTVVLIPSKRPLYALVSLDRGPNAVLISENVDSTLFLVFPDTEAFSKSTVNLTPNATGERRQLSVKLQQFPFVCAVGATIYKVQGESLKSMTVVDWKSPVRGANKPQQAYLLVSRVVKRIGFACMSKFTPALTTWSKPPSHAIDEDRRLHSISSDTLRELGVVEG